MSEQNADALMNAIRGIVTSPGRYDFFQACRLIERAGRDSGFESIGEDHQPAEECLRIRVLPALNFQSATIAKVTKAENGIPELVVTLGGLIGPHGVMPQHYTALVMHRNRVKDYTLRDFLDMFQHRVVSLAYRAWEKSNLVSEADSGQLILQALSGVATSGFQNRTRFAGSSYLYYSGILATRPATPLGLKNLLAEYFEWPINVEEFQGQWIYLDGDDLARLPIENSPGMGLSLGNGAVIGRRVWDVQNKIQIRIGPLDFQEFQSLQPGGDAREALSDLTRFYIGAEYDVEIQPILRPEAVPTLELEPDEENGPQLGRNCWLASQNFGNPVSDARFIVAG